MACLATLSGPLAAQDAPMPGLFPLAPPIAYPVTQTSTRDFHWQPPSPPVPEPGDLQPSPSDRVPDPPLTPPRGPEFDKPLFGDPPGANDAHSVLTESSVVCGDACPSNRYAYANGLLLTRDKRGGAILSTDGGTPELVFNSPEFDNRWYGGFEVGGGWCLGPGNDSAIEGVYWGLFPAPREIAALGTLDATIDFSQLDYQGGGADLLTAGAAAQRLIHDFDFHSAELTLVGNGCCGGPLGCGRCGCCNGSRGGFGFGWMAGFRYLHFSEDFLFSSDLSDTVFDESADEIHYAIDLDNNLYGFQMGAGLNYCVTDRFQARAIGRAGVYGNQVTHRQAVYGPGGNAVLNSGDFAGEAYVIADTDADLAVAGQLDVGGRWAFHANWSFDFGYRVLGIAGVATVEDNLVRTEFQNAPAAGTNTGGSLLLHGGYFGLTYCW